MVRNGSGTEVSVGSSDIDISTSNGTTTVTVSHATSADSADSVAWGDIEGAPSVMEVAEGTTGSATTPRTMTAVNTAGIVRGTKLTGLSTSTNSAVVATDSVLVGVGKLQAQVNGHNHDTVYVKKAQGSSYANKVLYTNSSGTVTPDAMKVPITDSSATGGWATMWID